jgi:hypothetical protein
MVAQVGPFDFQRKPLGISSLRFIPKTESLRPIANLSSTVSIGSWRVPVNNQLFRVLRIWTQNASGCSIKDFTELHAKLKTLKDNDHSEGPWYMISVDIKSCFDSINTTNLLQVLDQLLRHKVYYFHYAKVLKKTKNDFIKTTHCFVTSTRLIIVTNLIFLLMKEKLIIEKVINNHCFSNILMIFLTNYDSCLYIEGIIWKIY